MYEFAVSKYAQACIYSDSALPSPFRLGHIISLILVIILYVSFYQQSKKDYREEVVEYHTGYGSEPTSEDSDASSSSSNSPTSSNSSTSQDTTSDQERRQRRHVKRKSSKAKKEKRGKRANSSEDEDEEVRFSLSYVYIQGFLLMRWKSWLPSCLLSDAWSHVYWVMLEATRRHYYHSSSMCFIIVDHSQSCYTCSEMNKWMN